MHLLFGNDRDMRFLEHHGGALIRTNMVIQYENGCTICKLKCIKCTIIGEEFARLKAQDLTKY